MPGSNETPENATAGRTVMGLLGKQLELYRRLEQLADEQRRLIEIDDARPLLRLLSQRQKLTASLTQLGADLAPYRKRWDEIRSALVPAKRQVLDDMLDESRVRLRKILDKDDADGRLLAARKARIAQSMGTLETARRTLDAYGGTAGAAATGSAVLNSTEA